MANSSTSQATEISELRSRVEWLDEERRKYMRRLSEIEQQLNSQTRKRAEREQRIETVERSVETTKTQVTRLGQLDDTLAQFKDEIVTMIEQYDKRRIAGQDETDRRQRVEQEVTARELADIRKELPAIPRLENSLELRQAEEGRLAQLIGKLQNRLNTLDGRLEEQQREISYAGESEKQNSRQLSELQASIHDLTRRWEPANSRIDSAMATAVRLEGSLATIVQQQDDLKHKVENWAEQVQLGEYQRNQRLDEWRRALDDNQNQIEQFRRDWVRITDAFKEAKLALETMAEWQKGMEDRHHELSEMVRIESNRMLSRWDEFLLENEKRWKNNEVDTEQRWAAANRFNKQLSETLHELEEAAARAENDDDLLWRVQSAQADALKQLPRVWLEEVNKAISQNPNRRRQPTLVTVTEDQ